MENNRPLLSICIPTWNRSKFLSLSLNRFKELLANVDHSEIELFVSDNCSDDDTPEVVQSYIDQGMPITYSRNEENVGAARNFIYCMQRASGKYIYLLGDDDLLKPGSVSFILNQLRNNDYGLIHLSVLENKDNLPEIQEFGNLDEFLKEISFWITFMSGCIFLKESVALIEDKERFIPTHLLQMPFYLKSASLRSRNLFIRKSLMESGLDAGNNGGYNYFQVFVKHYLSIWNEFFDSGIVSKSCLDFIKKDIYVNFIEKFNYTLLIRRKNIATENKKYVGNRKGFKIKGAWGLLFKYYGREPYFYRSFVNYVFFLVRDCVRKMTCLLRKIFK